jgi:hypothetical protein
MDPARNPFAPGAGQAPPELAGRDAELRAADVVFARVAAGTPDRGIVLVGLRGFGKTVLMREFRSLAIARGWITAWAEAEGGQRIGPSIAQSMNVALHAAARGRFTAALRRALAVFKSFSLSLSPDGRFALGIDVEPERGRAATGNLGFDLLDLFRELGEAARELDIGVALFLDEMQLVPREELLGVLMAIHQANQDALPVAVFGAGLPNLPATLADTRSYAERLFLYRRVGPLDDAAAAAALTRPTEARGVEWDASALSDALAAAHGYPYFLQEYGRAIWDFAPGSPITEHDAAWGVEAANASLEHGFYLSRWERASDVQQEYLRAVAALAGDAVDDDAPVATSAVAQRMGRTLAALSSTRDQLIRKNLLYAPDRGSIAFTVPGMAAYVRRQRPT